MSEIIPRQQKRIAVPLDIELQSSSGKREARLSDLSIGGCYVDSIAIVKENEKVHFSLSLPSGQKEEMSGSVVYIHPGVGFGLRFDNLSDQQRTILQQVILLSGGGNF